MKKIIITIAAITLATALTNCAKSSGDNTPIVEFRAGMGEDSPETRLTLVDKVKVRWVNSDKVSIFDDNATNCKFTATTADEGVTATLRGTGTFAGVSVEKQTASENLGFATTYYATYPYVSAITFDQSTKTFSFPANTTISGNQFANSGDFSKGKGTNNAQGVYVAKSGNGFFHFVPVTAFLKFTLTQNDIKKIRFNNNGNAPQLAGTFTVDYSGDTPVITPTSTNSNEVVFAADASFSAAIPAGTYYLSVLPFLSNKGTDGETIQIKCLIHTDETANGKHVKQINLTRYMNLTPGKILDIGTLAHD